MSTRLTVTLTSADVTLNAEAPVKWKERPPELLEVLVVVVTVVVEAELVVDDDSVEVEVVTAVDVVIVVETAVEVVAVAVVVVVELVVGYVEVDEDKVEEMPVEVVGDDVKLETDELEALDVGLAVELLEAVEGPVEDPVFEYERLLELEALVVPL